MKMGLEMDLRLARFCKLCGGDPCHSSCLLRQRDQLRMSEHSARCPICNRGQLGINSWGFWECRSCHSQLSTSSWVGSADGKTYYVDDVQESDLLPAILLPAKGSDIFPRDAQIKGVSKEIERRLAKAGRRRR